VGMQQSDFIAHLDRKGVCCATEKSRIVGLSKLTALAFADELAAFYRCDRVQRRDLLGHRFAGAELSPRFLREEQLFPYKHSFGTVTLAIARPIEDDTIRAAEIALQQSVAIRCRNRFIAGPRAIGPAWSPLISRGCRRVTVKFCVPAIELRPRDVLARRPFVFFGTLRLPELWWPSR
jgi:hypothetical protein